MSERAREVAQKLMAEVLSDCKEPALPKIMEALREYTEEADQFARIAAEENADLRAKLMEVEEELKNERRARDTWEKTAGTWQQTATRRARELGEIDSHLAAQERIVVAARDWKVERYRLHKDGSPSYESQKAAALAVAIDEYDRTTALSEQGQECPTCESPQGTHGKVVNFDSEVVPCPDCTQPREKK